MDEAKRLIDVNKALQMMQDIKSSNPYIFNRKKKAIWELALTCAMARIESCPTVEVVRCKDCKHYIWHEADCAYVCLELCKFVKEDFWCARGERTIK